MALLISVLVGCLLGYAYGMLFWHEKKSALSASTYNEKKLKRLLALKYSARLFLIISFFLILLLFKSFNPILVLVSMLATFWLLLLKKERVI
jgi:hypothetical protein